jgi:tRNA(Arg) A34 adenosine deaminase TadA
LAREKKMNNYMKVAKDLADNNLITNVGGPFGACIVKDGKIIGRGSNHVLANNDPTAHAEIMAIRDACKNINSYDLSGSEIYTSCYPCPMCMSAIIWSNIKTIYYGNTKEDAANIGFRDDFIYDYFKKISCNEKTDLLKLNEIDRAETIKTFNDFVSKNDKTIY